MSTLPRVVVLALCIQSQLTPFRIKTVIFASRMGKSGRKTTREVKRCQAMATEIDLHRATATKMEKRWWKASRKATNQPSRHGQHVDGDGDTVLALKIVFLWTLVLARWPAYKIEAYLVVLFLSPTWVAPITERGGLLFHSDQFWGTQPCN